MKLVTVVTVDTGWAGVFGGDGAITALWDATTPRVPFSVVVTVLVTLFVRVGSYGSL